MSINSKISLYLHRIVKITRDRPDDGVRSGCSLVLGKKKIQVYVSSVVSTAFVLFALQYLSVRDDWAPGLWLVLSISIPLLVFALNLVVGATIDELARNARHLSAELDDVNRKLRHTKAQLREVTTLDELTGCYNAQHFQEVLSQHMSLCDRFDYKFSLVVIQIDQLIDVLEVHGLETGNEIARLFGRMVKGTLREVDAVGRLSVEDFAMLISGADESEAVQAVNRINNLIAQLYVPGDTKLDFTTSAGVCAYSGAESPTQLLRQASEALDLAVNEGRDRVACYVNKVAQYQARQENLVKQIASRQSGDNSPMPLAQRSNSMAG